jgi:hypothetical protein
MCIEGMGESHTPVYSSKAHGPDTSGDVFIIYLTFLCQEHETEAEWRSGSA